MSLLGRIKTSGAVAYVCLKLIVVGLLLPPVELLRVTRSTLKLMPDVQARAELDKPRMQPEIKVRSLVTVQN